MGVFHDDQAGGCDLHIAVIRQAGAHGCRVHHTVHAFWKTEGDSGELAVRAGLMRGDMRGRCDYDAVAAAGVREQRAGVALHAGSDEQSRLLAEPLGGIGFQLLYGRVILEDIVAHNRAAHRIPHGLGGLCDRIAAQINKLHKIKTFLKRIIRCAVSG